MRARLYLLLPLFLFVSACSPAPPQKELDRAQGAIDAARAAGAETYAHDSFTAATSALQQAHNAVSQNDYRLALTRALDAYARAQEAARGAADGKARARSEAEGALTAATAAVHRLTTRVTSEAGRIPKNEVGAAKKAHADAQASLQKARAALNTGNYFEARDTARQLTTDVNARLQAMDTFATGKPPRRRR